MKLFRVNGTLPATAHIVVKVRAASEAEALELARDYSMAFLQGPGIVAEETTYAEDESDVPEWDEESIVEVER